MNSTNHKYEFFRIDNMITNIRKDIFVLEDDMISLKLIGSALEKYGFSMLPARDKFSAFEVLTQHKFIAAILDLSLPDISGIEILKKIRSHAIHGRVPILILTSNDDKTDTILALEMGADDYITKPFNSRELIARLNAHIRRVDQPSVSFSQSSLILGNLVINIETREVTINQSPIYLTYNEFELLLILASNIGKVLSRDTLLNQIWGYDFFSETRTIDIHISSLRKKIAAVDQSCQYVETVRGVGYRFKNQPASLLL